MKLITEKREPEQGRACRRFSFSVFRLVGNLIGGSAVYESLLRVGKQKKLCAACNRHLNNEELAVFEKHVRNFFLPVCFPCFNNLLFSSKN